MFAVSHTKDAVLPTSALVRAAILMNAALTSALGAFFHVGFHGKNADMSDSGGVEVVKDLDGGQFDLQFCSTACLRQFFSTIVDEVEKSISRQKPLDGVEDAE